MDSTEATGLVRVLLTDGTVREGWLSAPPDRPPWLALAVDRQARDVRLIPTNQLREVVPAADVPGSDSVRTVEDVVSEIPP